MILKEREIVLPEPVDETAHPTLAVYPLGPLRENPKSYALAIQRIAVQDLRELNETKGVPQYFALEHTFEYTKLLVWPAPDKEYHADFTFNPPRRRI